MACDPVDDWTDQLKSICGNFNPRGAECKVVTGSATLMGAGGLELAKVANDLDFIDIKRD